MPGLHPANWGVATGPRSKARPPDSLPIIDCGHAWCGGYLMESSDSYEFRLYTPEGRARVFCSWGCVGRYAARMELRS